MTSSNPDLDPVIDQIGSLARSDDPLAPALLRTLIDALSARNASTKKPTPASPTKFSGSKKSHEAVQQFTGSLDIYFGFYPTMSDYEKISLAQTYFEPDDIAAQWFRPYVSQLSPDYPETDRPVWLKTWKEFKAELERRFGDPLDFSSAIQRITTLRQTKSVRQYAVAFQSAAARTNFDEATQIIMFRNGLQKHIAVALSAHEFSTINELISVAIRTDEVQHHHEDLDRRKGSTPTDRRSAPVRIPSTTPTIISKAPTIVPMEVDTTGALRRGPLTAEEKAYRRANGLCNYCGKPGHIATQCPNKVSRQSATNHLPVPVYRQNSSASSVTPSMSISQSPRSQSSESFGSAQPRSAHRA